MSLTEALDRLAVICRTHDAVFASWGHEDRKQILDSCSRFGIDYPFSNQHLNIKTAFAAFRDIPPVSTAEALRLVGLKLVGTHHRALDDARNVACLSAHLIRNGFEFHI